jgi:hypothetical protein
MNQILKQNPEYLRVQTQIVKILSRESTNNWRDTADSILAIKGIVIIADNQEEEGLKCRYVKSV